MVICYICSRELTQLTSSHLRPHGISIAEYKIKFPGAEIVSKEIRDKIANANKGKVRSPEAFQYRIEKDAIKNYVAIKKGFKIYRIKVAQHLPDNWIQILRDQGCDLF